MSCEICRRIKLIMVGYNVMAKINSNFMPSKNVPNALYIARQLAVGEDIGE